MKYLLLLSWINVIYIKSRVKLYRCYNFEHHIYQVNLLPVRTQRKMKELNKWWNRTRIYFSQNFIETTVQLFKQEEIKSQMSGLYCLCICISYCLSYSCMYCLDVWLLMFAALCYWLLLNNWESRKMFNSTSKHSTSFNIILETLFLTQTF